MNTFSLNNHFLANILFLLANESLSFQTGLSTIIKHLMDQRRVLRSIIVRQRIWENQQKNIEERLLRVSTKMADIEQQSDSFVKVTKVSKPLTKSLPSTDPLKIKKASNSSTPAKKSLYLSTDFQKMFPIDSPEKLERLEERLDKDEQVVQDMVSVKLVRESQPNSKIKDLLQYAHMLVIRGPNQDYKAMNKILRFVFEDEFLRQYTYGKVNSGKGFAKLFFHMKILTGLWQPEPDSETFEDLRAAISKALRLAKERLFANKRSLRLTTASIPNESVIGPAAGETYEIKVPSSIATIRKQSVNPVERLTFTSSNFMRMFPIKNVAQLKRLEYHIENDEDLATEMVNDQKSDLDFLKK